MSQLMTREIADAILARITDTYKAGLFIGNTEKPFLVQSVTLDLTTARLETDPFKIGFGFRSFYVSAATDVAVNVNLKPGNRDSSQSAIPIKKNDSLDFEIPVSEAYIHWDAQTSKSITILFFTNASFRSGSQISVTGGGVSINEGSSFTQASVALVAATPTAIFAADSTRKVGVFQNKSGASVWVGGPTVTNSLAFYEVTAGSEFIWKNTAALSGFSLAGGTVHKTEEF